MSELHPDDLKLLVRLLRQLRGWDQEEMAAAAGLDPSSVSRYENGRTAPHPKTLDRLVTGAGLSSSFVDHCLLPVLRAARLAVELSMKSGAAEDLESAVFEHGEAIARGLSAAVAAAFLGSFEKKEKDPWPSPARPREEDHLEAAELWSHLKGCTSSDRRLLLEEPEYQTCWALAVRLSHESEDAACDSIDRARELAELAVWVAERVPGDEPWRQRLLGYCLMFLANALRVANDEQKAEAALARAWKLWHGGAVAASPLLAEWRLLDREASLRRDQRRFAQSLELSDRALAIAPSTMAGRILANKAVALEHMGEAERAIEALRQAAPLIDPQREPRLPLVVRFNLAVNLCHLDRFAEADALLPEIRRLAAVLDKQLDQVRVGWLEGKVAAGLGRSGQATAAFEQVQREFLAREMAYDYALVTLELVTLRLAGAPREEIRELARGMFWIFRPKASTAKPWQPSRSSVRPSSATASPPTSPAASLSTSTRPPRPQAPLQALTEPQGRPLGHHPPPGAEKSFNPPGLERTPG
ncbi:MAG: helix-turn-helix transcriptional regulator [Acidobacteriota bacterium]|nr:helix-turn-helix transcriptional regulator [Acidobacteriota bacterium]